MGGEDVVGKVKGVDELGVRIACRAFDDDWDVYYERH